MSVTEDNHHAQVLSTFTRRNTGGFISGFDTHDDVTIEVHAELCYHPGVSFYLRIIVQLIIQSGYGDYVLCHVLPFVVGAPSHQNLCSVLGPRGELTSWNG